MSKLRVENLNTRESQWDREGILGCCLGYVNFTKVSLEVVIELKTNS